MGTRCALQGVVRTPRDIGWQLRRRGAVAWGTIDGVARPVPFAAWSGCNESDHAITLTQPWCLPESHSRPPEPSTHNNSAESESQASSARVDTPLLARHKPDFSCTTCAGEVSGLGTRHACIDVGLASISIEQFSRTIPECFSGAIGWMHNNGSTAIAS